jgi:hypothetical protein
MTDACAKARDWMIAAAKISASDADCTKLFPTLVKGQDGSFRFNINTDVPSYDGPTCRPIHKFSWTWKGDEVHVTCAINRKGGDSKEEAKFS